MGTSAFIADFINLTHACHLRVRHRPHLLQVSLSHQAPAFLDEEYPIVISVTNGDDRDMDITVDVLLQPTDIDHASESLFMALDCSI